MKILYKHNLESYNAIIEAFKKSNKACIVQATGTGKSFVALQWLYDNRDKSALFLSPNNVINNNLLDSMDSCGLEFLDFPKLNLETYYNLKSRLDDLPKLDLIVLDEFHRCGAPVWGESVAKLIDKNPDAKILGLSATPIRYLDDHRDMSDELFEGNVALTLTLGEAIGAEILPSPKYVSAVYSFDYQLEKLQNRIDNIKDNDRKNELKIRLDEAKRRVAEADGLPEIFNKYIEKKNGRYIVFCRDHEHLESMKQELPKLLGNVNKDIVIHSVRYDFSDMKNHSEIRAFKEDNSDAIKLLFGVDMLNEGIHIKDIDGAIMMRPTRSPTIYRQQLGRALSSNNDKNPVIFDIVNNLQSAEDSYALREEAKFFARFYEKSNLSDWEPFKIYEDLRDIREIIQSIENDITFSWEDHINAAKEYKKEHPEAVTIPQNTIVDGIKIGKWWQSVKFSYKNSLLPKEERKNHVTMSITPERIKDIEELGLDLSIDIYEEKWKKNIEAVRNYKKEHPEAITIPASAIVNGIKIGEWWQSVKISYKNRLLPKEERKSYYKLITPERVKEIEELGLDLSIDLREGKWLRNLKAVKKYKKEHPEAVTIPKDTVVNGIKIGKWWNSVKDTYKNSLLPKEERKNHVTMSITPERIKDIEELGLDLSLDVREEQWARNIEAVKEYKKQHPEAITIPASAIVNGIKIGTWWHAVKCAYKNSLLPKEERKSYNTLITSERIKEIEELGLDLNLDARKVRSKKVNLKSIDKNDKEF